MQPTLIMLPANTQLGPPEASSSQGEVLLIGKSRLYSISVILTHDSAVQWDTEERQCLGVVGCGQKSIHRGSQH